MNIKVLSIEPTQEFKTFHVTVVIGEDKYQFEMTVETDNIANQNIQIINSDKNFLKTFKFHQKLAADISNLVFLVYNHQHIRLPVDMGEFFPRDVKPVLL